MKGCMTCLFALICVGLTTQTAAQSVKVMFYYINLKEWNEHASTPAFQSILASEANTYCYSHLLQCGLDAWLPQSTFRSSDVIILDGFPAKVKFNIVLEVKVQMNVTMNMTNPAQSSLSPDVVRTILKNSRHALKIATESWIIYIDEEHLSPPPEYRANVILIPIAFVVLLVLIVVTLSLHYWRKKKDQAEKMMAKKMQKSHGTSRVSPNHVPSVDYVNGNSKANQLQMIYPPSRQQRMVDQNSSLHTATPSNISMTTDVPDAAKYDKGNEKERRKHHKKRHRKKKPSEGEVNERHEDGQNYSNQRFAQPGYGENTENIEMRRNYSLE